MSARENQLFEEPLLEKILYLLDQVADEDRAILVKSKINQFRTEKFNLAKAMIDADYYNQYLRTLTPQQLEQILNAITKTATSGLQLKPKTHAALQYIYDGQTPRQANLVKEAFDTVGNFFARSLKEEEDRQYNQANQQDPKRALERREMQACGNPCAAVFEKFLATLPDANAKQQFNFIIRKTLITHKESTYELQKRLLYTASRLADALENSGKQEAANAIRAILNRAGYKLPIRTKPHHDPKRHHAPFWSKLDRYPKRLLAMFKPAVANKLSPQGSEITKPLPNILQEYDPQVPPKSNAVMQLQQLYDRMRETLDVQKAASTTDNATLSAPNKMTFAYDSRNSETPLSTPSISPTSAQRRKNNLVW